MSNVSTILDTIVTTMGTLFPDKYRLVNPYDMENNAKYSKRDGWGLVVRPGSLGDYDAFCDSAMNQSIGIVLCKEVIRLENDTTDFDTKVKALLEEEKTVRVDFLNSDQLGIESSIGKIDYVGHDGINFITSGKTNFIYIEVNFRIDIIESL
jgi:hypothetical protein